MFVVIAMIDNGIPGIIKFFSEEEESAAKDLYAKIRTDYAGRQMGPTPEVGTKASEGSLDVHVSLLHTAEIDEELVDSINSRKEIYENKVTDLRAFPINTGMEDNTGVDDSKGESMRHKRLKGAPDALYWSDKFNPYLRRKELNIVGFDSTLCQNVYLEDKVLSGMGDSSSKIPEIVTDSEDTSYMTLERLKLEKLAEESSSGIINKITKKAWMAYADED